MISVSCTSSQKYSVSLIVMVTRLPVFVNHPMLPTMLNRVNSTIEFIMATNTSSLIQSTHLYVHEISIFHQASKTYHFHAKPRHG